MMLMDSMKLAQHTLLLCRYGVPEAAAALEILVPVLLAVQEDHSGLVPVDDERLLDLPLHLRQAIAAGPTAEVQRLSDEALPLLGFCTIACVELTALLNQGDVAAARSLGYAVHFVPSLIRHGRELEPEPFRDFCLRITAFHWHKLSAEMHEALAGAAGLSLEGAEALASKDDFPIDMFGA
jgi:hypothetical protein